MDISSWLVDTIYWAARTGADGYGSPTYGTPVALPARVEGKNLLSLGPNPQLMYDHAICTLTQIGPDDQVWLPGANQTDTTQAKRPLKTNTAYTEDKDYQFYMTYL
jgi:hypothetical protein